VLACYPLDNSDQQFLRLSTRPCNEDERHDSDLENLIYSGLDIFIRSDCSLMT